MGLVWRNGRIGFQYEAGFIDIRAVFCIPRAATVAKQLQFDDVLSSGLQQVTPAPDQRYHYANYSQATQVAAALHAQGHVKEAILWVHLAAELLGKHLIAKITFAYRRVHSEDLPPPPGNKKTAWLITHDLPDILNAALHVMPSLANQSNISNLIFRGMQFKGNLGHWQNARYADPTNQAQLTYCRNTFAGFQADLLTFEQALNVNGALPW
jgi:hypothetical protein